MQETPDQPRTEDDASSTRGALAPGLRLRQYEIRAVIGQGGFGITYLARDLTLHRDVAIKEYLPTALALREGGETVVPRSTAMAADFLNGREKFLEEARTLAKLDHMPAVVRVIDFLEANGTAYMVMALARGETLATRLVRDGTLDPAAVDRLLPSLLDGLQEVHGAGFLHRDIKPANILLDQRGLPTLIDFGAARAALAGTSVAMTAVFTPGYAAPEQFTSARQGPWTDIYGLAATLYQAISGKMPPSAFDRMLADDYESLIELNQSGIVGGKWRLGLLAGIDKALSIHAASRPQSIAQWREMLSRAPAAAPEPTMMMPAARVDLGATKSLAPEAPPAPETLARPRLFKAVRNGAVVLAAVVAVGAGYFLLVSSKPATEIAKTMDAVDQEVQKARLALAAAEAAAKQRMEAERQRLAETEAQRLADVEAVEKKRREEEAQRQAAAQVERDRQAAEIARQQAEATAAAKSKADADEAKRQADAETAAKAKAAQEALATAEAERVRTEAAAARKQAEEAARQKAESAAAEQKRIDNEARQRADAAAAERKRVDEEAQKKAQSEAEAQKKVDDARQKAEADAAAKQQASVEADGKAAEAVEAGLRLSQLDRQRLQAALTGLGFSTLGTDGVFGPRTREMIASWQRSRNQAPTGFLNGTQSQALLKEAAQAVARFDESQKKIEEDKKKAEEEARKRDPTPPTASTPASRDSDRQAASVPAPTPQRSPPEEKSIKLVNKVGMGCTLAPEYRIRISDNKVELRIGGGWRTMEADGSGAFGSTLQSSTTGARLAVSGNLKARTISVTNLGNSGCNWVGSF